MVEASWELFWAMVVRSWVVLACFGAKLRYVGGKMVTKSAEMSQHMLQVEVQETILAATLPSWGRFWEPLGDFGSLWRRLFGGFLVILVHGLNIKKP